jgi:curved DNA-binding protein CbpA
LDELARAYVTLGVTPAASLADVRKRYKALVRQWHPDRFARDPQGQAEASLRMRAINDAFRAVVAGRAVPRFDPPAASAGGAAAAAHPRSSTFSGRRLTREEIDRMVEAMKNDGPFDWLMNDSWMELLRRFARRLLPRR